MGPGRDFELFTEAVQLPAQERVAFLNRVCAGDEALRHKIEALLKTIDRAGTFLESPPAGEINEERSKVTVGEKPGDRVGRYKLLQQIGEGGCGVVFLAEQEAPLRRRVALKVVKPGMDTRSVIARFEAERQALALMDHPNIAHVYDAGATESGRPYFVMELVRGTKITDYCEQKSLTTRERLDLFAKVCEAVQHAHQKGIIHRDLKPSNILVGTDVDGTALPKIIDFGIAKATTNQRLTDKTLFTNFEMLIGTPAYMSPEQANLSSVDVDTRTDIYSLGVLLYELLTGTTPFDSKELLKAGLDEVRRVITSEEPVPPSTRLKKLLAADTTTVLHRQQVPPARLINDVRGDLDWIVMKALEKDRARRYPTAHGLAMDVGRYLAGEAIAARPPSRVYKFRKVALRNKLLFASVGAIAALVFVSLIVVSAALAKERRSRARSEQVTTFLKTMLRGAGPIAGKGRDRTMLREILDQTAARLGPELSNLPEDEAELRNYIGKLYEEIGEAGKGEEMTRKALEIRRKRFGADSLEAAESLNLLGLELMAQAKVAEAERAHGEALAIRRRRLGNENAATATSLNDLAAVYREQGYLDKALKMAQDALEIRQRLFGAEHLDIADSLRNQAIILGSQGRWNEAKQKAQKVLVMRRKLLLPEREHIWIASALEDLAWAESGTGNWEESERLDAEALVMRQELLGETHPDVSRTLNALGQSLGNHQLPAADAVLKATLSIQRKLFGDDNRATIETLFALAKVLDAEGKASEAEPVWREAVALWPKYGEDQNELKLFILRGLAVTLEHQNKWSDAETIWGDSLVLWRKRAGNEHPESMFTLRSIGLALEAQHKWPEAESVHREALALSRKKGDENSEALADLEKVVRDLVAQQKLAEAQQLLDKVLTPSFVLRPESVNLLVHRVSVMGRRGRWREAAADASLALENQLTEHYRYHTLAALLAMTGDRPAYEQVCKRLVTKFADSTNPYVLERIVQDSLLLPSSRSTDLALMDKLADMAVTAGSGTDGLPYFQACKAMSHYRLGNFAEAIGWADRSARSSTGFAQAKAYAVMAMGHFQLGQRNEALGALGKGESLAPSISPEKGAEDLGESWVAWLMARISLDEATKLLQVGPTLKQNPNSP